MKLQILKGTTSKKVRIFVQNASLTDGSGLTGLVFNTASLTAYYFRDGDTSATVISLVTATLGTWTSSGFIVVDGTNLPGLYELDLPNAVLASGANDVIVMLKGATNMVPVVLEIQLTSYDPNDAVHLGLSAIPNATAGAANGLFICGTNAPVTITGSGDVWTVTSTGGNGNACKFTGNGTGAGSKYTGGATGDGIDALGGLTSGVGMTCQAQAGNSAGFTNIGSGSGPGYSAVGGATGQGELIIGGATSGDGIQISTTSGQPIAGLITGYSTVNDAGATATGFITSLTQTVDNFFKNQLLVIRSGALNGEVARITAYNGTTKAVTVDPALTAAPANGVSFSILADIPWSANTMTELTAVPAITGTFAQAVTWLFEQASMKITQTATTQTLFKSDAATTLSTSTVSDTGTVFTRGQFS